MSTSRRPRPDRRPTTTNLVLAHLTSSGVDFATIPEIAAALAQQRNRVSAALHHLRAHGAVDVIVQGGVGHWFATPAFDDRQRILAEIVTEYSKPNRRAARSRRGSNKE